MHESDICFPGSKACVGVTIHTYAARLLFRHLLLSVWCEGPACKVSDLEERVKLSKCVHEVWVLRSRCTMPD